MATQGSNLAAAVQMTARAGWRERHGVTVAARAVEEPSDAALQRRPDHLRGEIAEVEARAMAAEPARLSTGPPSA